MERAQKVLMRASKRRRMLLKRVLSLGLARRRTIRTMQEIAEVADIARFDSVILDKFISNLLSNSCNRIL
jgi:hypothetical protein